jgi:hypothetical protein
VIELLLAIEPLETPADAQRHPAETKVATSLIASALVPEEPFVLAAMDVILAGQRSHLASDYTQCSHYQ